MTRDARPAVPGQPILASEWNRLVAAATAAIRAGQGVEVRSGPEGVTISLAEGARPIETPARIVEVLGPPAGDEPTALNLGYRAARAGLPDDAAVTFEPARVVNRPDYTGDAVLVPARVGDPCAIRRWFDEGGPLPYLAVWTEAFALDLACEDPP